MCNEIKEGSCCCKVCQIKILFARAVFTICFIYDVVAFIIIWLCDTMKILVTFVFN